MMNRHARSSTLMARFLALACAVGSVTSSLPAPALAQTFTDPPAMRLAPTVKKPKVHWVPSPNFDQRPAWAPIDMIVIHDTESPGVTDARKIAKFFAQPESRVSAHYIIGKDGTIIQCVADRLRAWHAGPSYFMGESGLNDRAIGIELVNAETGHDPFTNAQYQSLIRLVSYLVATYHVPMDRIVGHKDITLKPWAKHDPARNFSWARLLGGVREALGPTTREADRSSR